MCYYIIILHVILQSIGTQVFYAGVVPALVQQLRQRYYEVELQLTPVLAQPACLLTGA